MIPFNVFLFLEGRRRNITKLPCYSLLAQLVSLPFAQNLFFLAILLTPAPLPDRSKNSGIWSRLKHPKSDSWVPRPFIITLWMTATYIVFYQTSDASNVNLDSFKGLVLASRVLVALPLLAPWVLPQSLGLELHRSEYLPYVVTLFKTIAAGNLVLYLVTTYHGMKWSAPDTYYHRHSIHLPFDVEKRSAWERTTSATGRILAATADHPVVQGATFDVVLSALSLGIWSAARSTNVHDMFACVVPGIFRPGDEDVSSVMTVAKPRRESKRPRSRGKVKKEEDSSEESYQPSEADSVPEGDVIPTSELDWESTAVALGLMVLGGLGFGSAGVMGAECLPVG